MEISHSPNFFFTSVFFYVHCITDVLGYFMGCAGETKISLGLSLFLFLVTESASFCERKYCANLCVSFLFFFLSVE